MKEEKYIKNWILILIFVFIIIVTNSTSLVYGQNSDNTNIFENIFKNIKNKIINVTKS